MPECVAEPLSRKDLRVAAKKVKTPHPIKRLTMPLLLLPLPIMKARR